MWKTNKLLNRIEINPKKLGGKPVIRGTRISVEQVLNIIAAGVPIEEMLKDFPQLTKEDVKAAAWYASRLVEDFRVYPREFLAAVTV